MKHVFYSYYLYIYKHGYQLYGINISITYKMQTDIICCQRDT